MALAIGCAGTPKESANMECTARVAAGEDLSPHLTDGAVICLGPGTHAGGLDLKASVTLIGEAGAILDGGRRAPVVRVGENKLKVVLKGLTLTGGAHAFGSGLLVEGYSHVDVHDCIFEGNVEGEGHGAGLGARRGWLTLTGVRFAATDDVVITKTAEATFTGTTVEGDMRVLEKAKVTLDGGSVAGKLTLRGTTTSKPQLTLTGGASAPNLVNDPNVPGVVIGP